MELRSNSGVNTRMIQKLSPRQSSLETRMKILSEIAAENGVVLKLEDSSPVVEEESTKSGIANDLVDEVLSFSESRKGKKKYRDVEDAAQAAFESAAYAAAAARAAVELSRSRSFGSDNPDSPNSWPRKVLEYNLEKSKLEMKDNVVFDESDNEIENEVIDYSSSKQVEIESGFEEEVKMQPLDLTRRPMSVRTRLVYGW
ncbi:uncharacterized protein LOC143562412 [Bidens hawaiensis]|uniref:uncharacterized protein LOC143562412 n=1 Tax=Bidens hawaiensis TaxID=980011 RepID=UPI00404B3459